LAGLSPGKAQGLLIAALRLSSGSVFGADFIGSSIETAVRLGGYFSAVRRCQRIWRVAQSSAPVITRNHNSDPHLAPKSGGTLLVWILHRIAAELSAEPMPFDCERIVDSGFGWLITMEK
jgi:hypothetical protein